MLNESWKKSIHQVFNVKPRDGNAESTVWVDRKELEEGFEKYIDIPGMHICLDGPTGTGKTSLAKTILKRKAINYKRVPITKHTTWVEFCFNLIGRKNYWSSSKSAKLDIGVQKGLPTLLLQIAFGKSTNNTDDIVLREKISKTITENILCEAMVKTNESIFIDDFEKASDELVTRIADTCKILTDSFVESNAKLIFAGTDDIYTRLINANKALEERLREISIGSFVNKYVSWNFLRFGFEKLKIKNPSTDYNKKYIDKSKLDECVQKVYDAANGLPKSLNSLGLEICMKTRYDRRRVSPADIINTAEKKIDEHISKFWREIDNIIECTKNDIVAKDVLQHYFTTGIGEIHRASDVVINLQSKHKEEKINDAIIKLTKLDFLIMTGYHNNVLYVKKPVFAHYLGLVLSYPKKYKVSEKITKYAEQLHLPFFINGIT